MRRTATALGTLAAAGMLALAVPNSAHAAYGELVIGPTTYVNPSGCYGTRGWWPLHVRNWTDGVAAVYDAPGCTGVIIDFVYPNEIKTFSIGQSVYIR
ncbi:hypothetical protein Misp01_78510 [Microtetraspora sp. NBRC 13810]|uniref:hypothetical protein n=1 Tax=Microtetraspora sp. NBRC 13810 TaxID=3030990 RepID=UPI0024A4C12A|nr:hypothetical protein [Microtetraspora sp. NBRC 13810]GLW12723.1 hypothetical protein Misp01_78510 [Microtetraspora sp. NBRC 13810]